MPKYAVTTSVELGMRQRERDEVKRCRIAALEFYFKAEAITCGQHDWTDQKCGEVFAEIDEDVVSPAKLILAERADARMKGMSE